MTIKPTSTDEEPSDVMPTIPEVVEQAILLGMSVISDGQTKVQAVNTMYPLIADQPKERILKAFVDGAGLTAKGAVTYLYNVRRAVKRGKLIIPNDQ